MQNSALDIWISGAVAVVTVDFLVYPFDTLKTRIQSPDYNKIYKDASTNTIKKNVLFRGLYQGVVSVVLSTIPASGAFFTTYETVKSTLNTTSSSSSLPNATPAPLINALASCSAEAVSCLLLTPAEVLKQNAQVINRSPPSASASASATGTEKPTRSNRSVTLQVLSRFRSQPWRLWSGYSALLGRNLPFTGLNFPIFEAVKGVLVRRRRERMGVETGTETGTKKGTGSSGEEPVFERAVLTGVAASISGSIASVITTPIDVVKTRMMLAATRDSGSSLGPGSGSGSGSEAGDGVLKKAKDTGGQNVWSVGRQIFRDEGVKGLFRGGAIRVVWTAISLSIYLGMYEGGRYYLEKRRTNKAEDEGGY